MHWSLMIAAFSYRASAHRLLFLSLAVKRRVVRGSRRPLAASCFAEAATKDPLDRSVIILKQTNEYVVVDKPPSVVCHHSDWTGSRSRNEVPMLQRVREATCYDLSEAGSQAPADGSKFIRRVNLVHRLDRGCSGCLLLAFAPASEPHEDSGGNNNNNNYRLDSTVTSRLIRAMQSPGSTKTYVALVRGEGVLRGRDFRKEGWFLVDRPIKDENGKLNSASTWFRFAAGQDDAHGSRPRASLVLCRPTTGRWHQVRRHLNGLSHPILGDSSHGNSKVNQMWRNNYGMLPERTCLHLARLQLSFDDDDNNNKRALAARPETVSMEDIDVSCPLASDMRNVLTRHLPLVLEHATPILRDEGVTI